MAVIGTLATLTTYVVTSAQKQARDAKRRSDLTAIGVGFQARFESQVCSAPADKQKYPGHGPWRNPNNDNWQSIADALRGYTDSCGAFSEYLSTIPSEPRYESLPYQFNLSCENGVCGQHFRLRAHLEKSLSSDEVSTLTRQSLTWRNTFGGRKYEYDINDNFANYRYFIGN